jgi:large subunit ribosomal protein L33
MAKGKDKKVRMVSTAGTGYFYTMPSTAEGKLSLKKYDPRVRKHVMFKQEKIK